MEALISLASIVALVLVVFVGSTGFGNLIEGKLRRGLTLSDGKSVISVTPGSNAMPADNINQKHA